MWLMPSRTRNRFIAPSKVLAFSPLPHHIGGGVLGRGQIHRTLGSKSLEMRGRLPLRQKR
jgi:hypothetical protein